MREYRVYFSISHMLLLTKAIIAPLLFNVIVNSSPTTKFSTLAASASWTNDIGKIPASGTRTITVEEEYRGQGDVEMAKESVSKDFYSVPPGLYKISIKSPENMPLMRFIGPQLPLNYNIVLHRPASKGQIWKLKLKSKTKYDLYSISTVTNPGEEYFLKPFYKDGSLRLSESDNPPKEGWKFIKIDREGDNQVGTDVFLKYYGKNAFFGAYPSLFRLPSTYQKLPSEMESTIRMVKFADVSSIFTLHKV